ncbi:MAG TPA: hypothetical protein VMV50_01625 [Candidatus Paceibacterota bacterium]|nr:hypothetical protein [Candidatus Paceibacterota bacterium]
MPSGRGWVLFFIGGLALVIGGTAFYYNAEIADVAQADALGHALQDYIVPTIGNGEATYTVDSGGVRRDGTVVTGAAALPVLRLAYFSVANRLDPILALDETSTTSLAASVAALKHSLDALAAPYDAQGKALLADSFYPVTFLETLPSLEAERRAVLAHPTYADAMQYGTDLIAALKAYRTALSKSFDAFSSFNEATSTNFEYVVPGGSTSPSANLTGLASLDADAAAAEAEAAARLACLEGNGDCAPLAALEPPAYVPPLPSAVPPVAMHVRSLLDASGSKHAADLGETFRQLGIVVLAGSACVPDFSPFYAYLWETQATSSVPELRYLPLNDLYFYDLRAKVDTSHSPYYAALLKASGIRYLNFGVSNLYECPDSGFEAMQVATLYALAQDAATRPLFATTTVADPALMKVQADERRIAQSPVILESEVARYVGDLATLVNTDGETELAAETSPATVFEAERRIALAREQSASFGKEIATAVATNAVSQAINRMKAGPIPLFGLYFTRSYPSLFYLAWNGSIAPAPVSFFETKRQEPLANFQIVPYTQLRRTYSDAAILRFIEASNEADQAAGVRI